MFSRRSGPKISSKRSSTFETLAMRQLCSGSEGRESSVKVERLTKGCRVMRTSSTEVINCIYMIRTTQLCGFGECESRKRLGTRFRSMPLECYMAEFRFVRDGCRC